MGKRNVLLTLFFMGIFSLCLAQEKKNVPEDEGLTRKAVVIANNGLRLDKEQVFEGKYLQNETDMAYRSQAKERAICDFGKKYGTTVIVEPYVTVKKKKGYFIVKVKGCPVKGIAPDMHKTAKGGTSFDRKVPQDEKFVPVKRQ